MLRTFIVLSFTMLADGTIRQATPVALPKAFAAGLTGLTEAERSTRAALSHWCFWPRRPGSWPAAGSPTALR